MKKKIIIISIIIILSILVIPKKKELWDGGTREYRAILYKYTKYKGINKYDYDIKSKLEILGFKVFEEKREQYTYEANYLIYAPENNGVSEDDIQKQEDYSKKIEELFTSSRNMELIQPYFESLYGITDKKIDIKIKSIDENNTKYHFELKCDEFDKEECSTIPPIIFQYPLNQAEILYKLYIHRISYSIK